MTRSDLKYGVFVSQERRRDISQCTLIASLNSESSLELTNECHCDLWLCSLEHSSLYCSTVSRRSFVFSSKAEAIFRTLPRASFHPSRLFLRSIPRLSLVRRIGVEVVLRTLSSSSSSSLLLTFIPSSQSLLEKGNRKTHQKKDHGVLLFG